MVHAERAAEVELPEDSGGDPPLPDGPGQAPPLADEGVILDHEWDGVRRLLWYYVGLVRTHERLAHAVARLELMQGWACDLYRRYRPSRDLVELRNIGLVGLLLARSAMHRRESRGLHTLADEPRTLPTPLETWARWTGTEVQLESRPLPGPNSS